ncbi:inosine monophosphate dehydrogenase [Polychaeton citri CBS 116435]|uniref:Inosine monophosphate dehydrogenase n=1 Tax=Polychaeton citri CBS 116435 TaxID=1314669 RepID=A0A9P4UPA8_9PEZI|nr:inosine monophosphate dehydrogenase [Polychaeton citri CBS 116435]
MASALQKDYPWTLQPLIAGAPMRLIALSDLAFAISSAGGLGFMGIGSDASCLHPELRRLTDTLIPTDRRLQSHLSAAGTLPIGLGVLVWAGAALLTSLLAAFEPAGPFPPPAAIWLFAPAGGAQELAEWTGAIRAATAGRTKVWIQVGTTAEAVAAVELCAPDVLVVQGSDAGGHGLLASASLLTLLPEVQAAVSAAVRRSSSFPGQEPAYIAAGGLSTPATAAAALALGAPGLVLGTRFLASREAVVPPGYQAAVLAAKDGGVSTARGRLYDQLRGTTAWPARYGGRGVLNRSWWDAHGGMGLGENKRLYDLAATAEEGEGTGDGWGSQGRLTAYAGTGVGLITGVKGAGEIVAEIREGAVNVLKRAAAKL